MRRILVEALVAYTLSTTLLAAWWWAQASSCRNLLEVAHHRASEAGRTAAAPKALHSFYLGYGVDMPSPRYAVARFVDIGEYVVAAMVGVIAFRRLYAESREGNFLEAFRSIYGAGLDDMEDRFWGDARSTRD
jgi:hypothetical protein